MLGDELMIQILEKHNNKLNGLSFVYFPYNQVMSAENQEALLDNLNSPAKETKYKDYDYIFKVVLNISLASAYSGYTLAYFNTINFDHTIQIFDIHHDRAVMQGLLSFCVAIGAAAGGYLATFVIRNFSRK